MCPACNYAAQNRIPVVAYPASPEKVEEDALHNASIPKDVVNLLLNEYKVNYVVLAGYLKVVLHPSLQNAQEII